MRSGTSLVIFLNDKYIATADLANNNSGVTTATLASVQLRHYDDTGVEVVIPFEITDSVQKVTVSCSDSTNGTVKTNKTSYVLGEAVTVAAQPWLGWAAILMEDSVLTQDVNTIFTVWRSQADADSMFIDLEAQTTVFVIFS